MSTAPRHDTPLSLADGRQLRNRVWLAPMTNQQSHADGHLSDDELAWLEARARGGFAVVQTCATHVTRDGQGWPGELGIFAEKLIDDWARLADAMHAHGAWLMPQLFHGGMRAPASLTGQTPFSADAAEDGSVRAATEEDLERVVDAFGAAGRRAHEAGADGVELHGAHGYLLCQFLSTALNHREDAWGGTLEGRARLVRRCLAAVRAQVPTSFVVGVRLSPENYGGLQGLDLDDSLQVARWLAEEGADFIHLSLWDAHHNTTKRPESHAVEVFRAALPPEVLVVVAGNLWTAADAERMLALGADAVALGRAAILNPDWPTAASREDWAPRRPPVTRETLRRCALGPAFVEYMARWPGFVDDSAT